MKIKANVGELLKKVQRAQMVIASKITIPVLSYLKLDVTQALSGTLVASDLGASIVQTVPLELHSDPGVLMLPARELGALLAGFKQDSDVILETDPTAQIIHIKNAKFKGKLTTVAAATFPQLDPWPGAALVNFNAEALKRVTTRAEWAAPSKGGRVGEPSVLVESIGELLRAVATDGFRIVVSEVKGAGVGNHKWQFPKASINLLKDVPGTVISFAVSDNNYFFQGEGELLMVRKPSTVFPNWERALSQQYLTGAKVNVEALKEVITRVQVFADEHSSAILEVAGNELIVTLTNPATGEGVDRLDIELTDKVAPNKVRLNPKFLGEFLGNIEGAVLAEFSTERSLMRFTNDKADYTYLLMPTAAPESKTTESKT